MLLKSTLPTFNVASIKFCIILVACIIFVFNSIGVCQKSYGT